jgi:hypothetical protein
LNFKSFLKKAAASCCCVWYYAIFSKNSRTAVIADNLHRFDFRVKANRKIALSMRPCHVSDGEKESWTG